MPGLAGEVANLIVALKLDDSGFTGKLNAASGALKRMDGGLSQVGRGVGQVGSGLLRMGERAALAAAGGLTAVVTTAASFEQAFTGVEKTVDGTDRQLAKLEETIRQMARTVPVSFEELSAIGEAGGALGVARESLDEFIDVVARLAVSTDLSSEQAATALGQLGTILDLSEKDFADFGDSLVALGNAGASTESQIVEMAARFAASGKQAGLTKEEILALASATASMGIEVEAGGTALSQTFDKITLGIATNSKEVKAFTRTMGISAAEFRKRWEQDALGTFQEFLAEISKLDRFDQAAILEKAGITGIRQQRAVLLMTQNLGFLNEQLDISRNATGALNEESDKFFKTSVGQWKILTNNVRDAAATIGAELLPVANELMSDFVRELQKPSTQAGLKTFAQDLARGVRGLVNELKGTDFSGIIGGMKLAAEVAKGAFDAFRALPQPIQQLAIAALVANKVSGGAVGQIARGLGNIALGGGKLFAGLRGQTPASPQYVWVVNQGVGAGGRGAPLPPGAAPPGGFLAPGLGTLGVGIALPFLMFNLIPELFRKVGGGQSVRRTNESGETIVELGPTSTAMMQGLMPSFISSVERTGGEVVNAVNDDTLTLAAGVNTLRDETRQLHNPLLGIKAINERSALGIEDVRDETRQLQRITGAELREVQRREQATADRIRDARAAIQEQKLALDRGFGASNARLERIANKDFSPNVNVVNSITAHISTSVAEVLRTATIVSNIRTNTNSGGFI